MRALLALAGSAGWIAAVQAVNFLVPLASVPFLLRGLGVEGFSRYAVLMAGAGLFVIFADFSFNVTGPLRVRRAVAEGRLGGLVADSLVLKTGLMLPAAVVLLWVAGPGAEGALALGYAAAATLTPRWVVYSLGRVRAFAVLSGCSRLAWLGAVILAAPGGLVPVLAVSVVAQGAIMSGAFLLVSPAGAARVGLRAPAGMLREDLGQFGAILAAAGGRELSLIILAAVALAPEVASFALADRVRVLMVGLVAPVTQALYLAIVAGRGDGMRRPASLLVLAAAAGGGAVAWLLAGPVVAVLGGGEVPGAVPVLRVLCLLPFLSGLTAILGTNTLLVEGRADAYAAIQTAVALAAAPLTVLAILRGGAVGAAWAAVAQEAALALLFALALRRTGLLVRVLR